MPSRLGTLMRRAAWLVILASGACAHGSDAPLARSGAGVGSRALATATLVGTSVAFNEASASTPAPIAVGKADGSIELHDGNATSVLAPAHSRRVVALAWHGDALASVGDDAYLRIWDSSSHKLRYTIEIEATSIAWNPSGRWLAVASPVGTRVYDGATGTLRQVFWGHRPTALAWRNDDVTLAVGNTVGGVSLFEARTGARIAALEGNASSTVPVDWTKLPSGTNVSKLQGNAGPVTHVDWSADGSQVLSASEDGAIKLWDATHRTLSRDVRTPSGRSHATAALCGDAVVMGDETGPLRRAPLAGPDDAAHEQRLASRGVTLARAKGGTLAAVDLDGNVTLDGTLSCTTGATPLEPLSAAAVHGTGGDSDGQGRINALAWSPDGHFVAATVMDPIDTVKVWDARTGEQALTATRDDVTFDWDVAFAPDGQSLAVTSKKSTVFVYDIANARWTAHMSDDGDADGLGLAFAPDGKWIASSATAGGIVDNGINLWAGAESKPVRLASCRTSTLVWGRTLDVRCLDHPVIEVWNPTARSLVRRVSTKEATGWSSDGQLFVSCTKRKISDPRRKRTTLCRIEEAATGRARQVVDLYPELPPSVQLALNVQGDHLAVNDKGSLGVWDLGGVPTTSPSPHPWTDAKRRLDMTEDSGVTKQMEWSPDGSRLATGARDKAVRVWEEGKLVWRLGGEL